MIKIINLITKINLTVPKLIVLILTYLLVRDIFPGIPYINLLIQDVSGQLVIFGAIILVLTKPSVNILLVLSGLLLVFNFLFTILEFSWGGEESFGLLIYLLLLFFAFRLLKGKF